MEHRLRFVGLINFGPEGVKQFYKRRGVLRHVIAATGASQFEFLDALTGLPEFDWPQVEMFNLEEYIGLPASHPASFCRYLSERLTCITKYFLLDGEDDPAEVMRRIGYELCSEPIDVAFVGSGENGHLAFNDPPADVDTEEPISSLKWMRRAASNLEKVGSPLSLSCPSRDFDECTSDSQILKAKKIVCTMSGKRKAVAGKACLEGEISPLVPSSILCTQPDTTVYLDKHSAALLRREILRAAREVDSQNG